MMRQREKAHYFQIYASWIKENVGARLKTYLDTFKEEGVVPDEADLHYLSWAFEEVIDNVTASLPQELKLSLDRLGREQII